MTGLAPEQAVARHPGHVLSDRNHGTHVHLSHSSRERSRREATRVRVAPPHHPHQHRKCSMPCPTHHSPSQQSRERCSNSSQPETAPVPESISRCPTTAQPPRHLTGRAGHHARRPKCPPTTRAKRVVTDRSHTMRAVIKRSERHSDPQISLTLASQDAAVGQHTDVDEKLVGGSGYRSGASSHGCVIRLDNPADRGVVGERQGRSPACRPFEPWRASQESAANFIRP
jgi:hypothetical protein